jgi:large subunit ribosomal protein L18
MRTVQYRRKREGRTNYKNRLNLLVSRKNRVVVRKSLSGIQIQVVEYLPDGDHVLLSVHSRDLKKYGLTRTNGNKSIAYLTGLLCGVKAKKAKITSGILDLGLQRAHPKGKLFAAAKGMVDAGFEIPIDEKALPSDEDVSGKLVESYATTLGEDAKKLFSGYEKDGVKVTTISKVYEDIKSKILAE